MNKFLDMVKVRRTRYAISNETTIPNEKIVELIEDAVNNTPSAFNSQSSRVVVLFNNNHKKVWQIVLDELKKVIPAETFAATEQKISLFSSGYATILYFEDGDTVKSLEEKFPAYKENFAKWSNQSSGMLQFVIWTALANEGLGASLQHYNPLIDAAVHKAFDIPASWQLMAQMPFGKPTAPHDKKEFMPIGKRIKLIK